MATPMFGGELPPVVLTLSAQEAQALLDDLNETVICEQSDRIKNALKNLLEG